MDTAPATLAGMLAQAPQQAVAVSFDGTQLSYAQLREQVGRVAASLQRLGLRQGDVLGIWLPNTPRWLVLHLACASLGIASLSLNLKLGVQELVGFIDRARCKALAFDGALALPAQGAQLLQQVWQQHAGSIGLLVDASRDAGAGAGAALAARPMPRFARWDDLLHAVAGAAADAADAADASAPARRPCIILSSSGTTSLPKLIVHSQSNVALHARDAARGFGVERGCGTLLALPLCGAFGYTAAMMTLAAGARLALHEVFDPVAAAHALEREPITHMFGTNDMVDKLIAPLAPGWRPQALRFFGHANFVPGLDGLPARAQALGIPMVGCFGMSEILALFAHQDPAAPLPRRAQSGGFAVSPAVQVRARVPETGALAAPMEPGELEFRGPYMLQEYLGNPEATAQAFTADGFLRSGDLGYLNGDGGFTHVARLGDVLRLGGFLVNPAEIEEAVLQHTGAEACQVVAVNAAGSSRPVAFVVPAQGRAIDAEAVKARLQRQIARYKVPIRIFSVENFPYTMGPNGRKVKRNELRETAQSWLAREGMQ